MINNIYPQYSFYSSLTNEFSKFLLFVIWKRIYKKYCLQKDGLGLKSQIPQTPHIHTIILSQWPKMRNKSRVILVPKNLIQTLFLLFIERSKINLYFNFYFWNATYKHAIDTSSTTYSHKNNFIFWMLFGNKTIKVANL